MIKSYLFAFMSLMGQMMFDYLYESLMRSDHV